VKRVTTDQSYIDYIAEAVGIRVRRSACRPIILERGRWREYGVSYSLPVEPRELQRQKTGISSLASNLTRVEESASGATEESELRRLLAGEICYQDALCPALQNA
jgi:hypothetical protein